MSWRSSLTVAGRIRARLTISEVAGSAATPTDYAFDLLAVTARDRGATAIGERLTGRLDAPGVVERWTLTTDGRRIFSLDEGTGACDDLAVHVTDAAGGQVGNALEPLCSGAFLGVPGSGTSRSRCSVSAEPPASTRCC